MRFRPFRQDGCQAEMVLIHKGKTIRTDIQERAGGSRQEDRQPRTADVRQTTSRALGWSPPTDPPPPHVDTLCSVDVAAKGSEKHSEAGSQTALQRALG